MPATASTRSVAVARALLLCVSGALGLLGVPGCNIVSAAAYFLSPPRVQQAEFKLTEGRLAVLVEPARPEEDNPVFTQALCEKLAEIFRDHKVKAQLIPQDEVMKLRHQNRDFAKWSLQKVGRRLNAQQVLYIRIDRLQMRDEPTAPVLHAAVRMRLKVIDPAAPSETARLWPGSSEPEGRLTERARPVTETGDVVAEDAEATKLGRDAAWMVAMPFYDVDLEKKTPWEP